MRRTVVILMIDIENHKINTLENLFGSFLSLKHTKLFRQIKFSVNDVEAESKFFFHSFWNVPIIITKDDFLKHVNSIIAS